MDELKRIIAEYKADVAAAGCEHQRNTAMIRAFTRILELVDYLERGDE